MNNRMKKRIAFHPSATEAPLEERRLLSSTSAVVSRTPPAAPPPLFSSAVIISPMHWTTERQLRTAFARQVQLATLDLRNAVAREVRQLFANGSVPTPQQLTDFNATVQGAIDATALRVSTQASLLPGAGTRLVPAIQNALLGSGSKSLSSELSSALQSARNTGSALRLQYLLGRQIILVPDQIISQFNTFFNTTNLNRLSVNSSGQQIPLEQFMAGQVVKQFSNTLGMLAQSFPNVANSMLFPNGATGNPTQDLLDAFGTQASNALATAAFQLGSSLALFPASASVISQIQPLLFGATTNLNSLASALQSLPFGGTGFNSAVSEAFNSGFSNLLGPITSFLGTAMPLQPELTLPTTGFASPFSSQFSGTSFNTGFNNGFATGTTPGFVGFGQAPSGFNANFGIGFNNLVSSVNQGLGFVNTPLGTTGTVGGVPVQSE